MSASVPSRAVSQQDRADNLACARLELVQAREARACGDRDVVAMHLEFAGRYRRLAAS